VCGALPTGGTGDPDAATGPWLLPPRAPQRRHHPEPGPAGPARVEAVLFDCDGTLVVDVPYNGDPTRVRPTARARAALAALRTLRIPLGVVSNQSGVAKGLLTRHQVVAVQARIEELLGPFDVWAVCPHGPDDRCGCRKPAPGLILAACRHLGADSARVVVIGDIGADLEAAAAAGARGILVPAPGTRAEEIESADETAPDLAAAVRLALRPALPGAGRIPSDASVRSSPPHRLTGGAGR